MASGAAYLEGAGQMSASAQVVISVAGALEGAGQMSTAGQTIIQGAAGLTGFGSLDGVLTIVMIRMILTARRRSFDLSTWPRDFDLTVSDRYRIGE